MGSKFNDYVIQKLFLILFHTNIAWKNFNFGYMLGAAIYYMLTKIRSVKTNVLFKHFLRTHTLNFCSVVFRGEGKWAIFPLGSLYFSVFTYLFIFLLLVERFHLFFTNTFTIACKLIITHKKYLFEKRIQQNINTKPRFTVSNKSIFPNWNKIWNESTHFFI